MDNEVLARLRQGRERISRGFCKFVFAEDADGNRVPSGSRKATAWCINGAIGFSYDDFPVVDGDVRKRTSAALMVHVPSEFVSVSNDPAWFNNADTTTQADVIALFDRAIAAESPATALVDGLARLPFHEEEEDEGVEEELPA